MAITGGSGGLWSELSGFPVGAAGGNGTGLTIWSKVAAAGDSAATFTVTFAVSTQKWNVWIIRVSDTGGTPSVGANSGKGNQSSATAQSTNQITIATGSSVLAVFTERGATANTYTAAAWAGTATGLTGTERDDQTNTASSQVSTELQDGNGAATGGGTVTANATAALAAAWSAGIAELVPVTAITFTYGTASVGGSGASTTVAAPTCNAGDLLLCVVGYGGGSPVLTPYPPAVPAAVAQPGQTWLRRFHHRQALPAAPPAAVTAQAGPPVYPLGHPVMARQQPAQGGRVSRRTGVYAQAGPPVKAAPGPVRARVPAPVRGGQVTRRAGVYGQLGPAVKALAQAVAGKLRGLPFRGRTAGRSGVYAQLGPPVKAAAGPVQARRLPARGGSAQGRVGTFTSVTPGTGPPVYPLGHPVQARRQPLRGGHISRATGVYGGTGAPVRPASGPVKAQPAPARGGRTASRAGTLAAGAPQAGPPVYPAGHPVQARSLLRRGGSAQGRAGTFTVTVTGSGPPVYPLGHPVQARRLPARGGSVNRRSGTYAGSGPPVKPLAGPVGVYRRQPPPPTRGRTQSQRGPYAQTGPPVVRLRRPVRGQPAKPLLTGRAAWRAGVYTAPIVAPFTVGALSASTAPTATLGAADKPTSALTATTAPSSAITAGTAPTGGPS